MAYGSWPLNKIQFGRETVQGTAVAATKVFRGNFAMLEDQTDKKVITEQIGQLVTPERRYVSKIGARLAIPSTSLTFEQLPDFLEGAVKTVTPTGVGPYVRVYPIPVDGSVNTIKTYTIEAGNTQVPTDTQEMSYSYVDELELSGKAGEPWMINATWIGRQLTPATFTAALAAPTVTDALFTNTKLYIDDSGGTIGTTQKLGTLIGARIRLRSGILQVPGGDGVQYFRAIKPGRPEVDFSITIEVESSSLIATERAKWVTDSTRLVRLLIDHGTNNKIQFDLAGVYDKIGNYENNEGNTVVTLDGHAIVDTTSSLFFSASVTNNVALL